jgi:hypothetical protein
LPCEGIVKLKQGSMAGVGIGQKDGVWEVCTQPIGVLDWNHLIMDAVHHQGRMFDALQVCEALTGEFLPVAKGC